MSEMQKQHLQMLTELADMCAEVIEMSRQRAARWNAPPDARDEKVLASLERELRLTLAMKARIEKDLRAQEARRAAERAAAEQEIARRQTHQGNATLH